MNDLLIVPATLTFQCDCGIDDFDAELWDLAVRYERSINKNMPEERAAKIFKRRARDLGYCAPVPYDYEENPDESELNTSEEKEIIRSCFSILDETSRKILAARYSEKLSFEQIAARMDFSNPVIAQFEFNKAFSQFEKISRARLNSNCAITGLLKSIRAAICSNDNFSE